jgi:hypothetical protein
MSILLFCLWLLHDTSLLRQTKHICPRGLRD